MATTAALSFRASRRCFTTTRSYASFVQQHALFINQNNKTKSWSSSQLNRLLQQQQHRWFASYPPHEVVGMPSLSPTMESGTIASWSISEGESFGAGDVLCSIETDKATVDFEAQDDGIIAKILQEPGPTDIPCGQPIVITVEEEESVSAFKDYQVEEAAATVAPPTPAELPTPEPVAAPAAPTPTPAAAAPPAATSGERVMASPLAHKLAKELGHSIAAIAGTGPGGRIIADDVREFVPMEAGAGATTDAPATTAAAASVASPPPIPGSGYVDHPISASASELAQRLSQAKRNVPHYYLTVDITMDALLELRTSVNGSLGEDSKLGTYEFLLKAAAAAMKAVPSVNASWRDSVVRVYDAVDINVAVGNGDALYTPVIRNVGTRGVQALSEELELAMTAVITPPSEDDAIENVELPSNFMEMGTFTVMNLGMYGIKSCAPIVREPQSCALALGVMENRIVPNTTTDDEHDDMFYKQSVVMTATLSCDHRVVDGAVGAQWLSAFKSHVEHPHTLLL